MSASMVEKEVQPQKQAEPLRQPGLTKQLAHRWHGPFRVKRKVEEFAYELELPDRSGYRFYPVVHLSRLMMVDKFGDRPSARLTRDVDEATRLDFDEELLPEDSWEPDHVAGEFEVEAILDDMTPLSTSTQRAVREFKVKWVGYDDPTWDSGNNQRENRGDSQKSTMEKSADIWVANTGVTVRTSEEDSSCSEGKAATTHSD
ncbi:hypothetical protein PHMEG_00030494 [Phytophthora megakarya]|uniref:Chromo domain-containing protein n=1 Tax=Phytophthora megakarya TaxID=4795 RepID=A0A225V064_9STRA|nr:hypothetical protein PHMEG_00030494 [Phytophthora megakarya]